MMVNYWLSGLRSIGSDWGWSRAILDIKDDRLLTNVTISGIDGDDFRGIRLGSDG